MEGVIKKTNWTQLLSFLIIIFLGIEDVLLIFQNRELKAALKGMTTEPVEPLKHGERIESVKLQTLDGNSVELNYNNSDKKYLLFVLSTSCPHCEKTLPVWQSIASKKMDNCNIIGIVMQNLDETKKYVTTRNVNFVTVSAEADTSFSRKYKIGGVPETILINSDGTVEKSWVGELSGEQEKEIETLLGSNQTQLIN